MGKMKEPTSVSRPGSNAEVTPLESPAIKRVPLTEAFMQSLGLRSDQEAQQALRELSPTDGDQDYLLPSAQARILEAILERPDIPESARELLGLHARKRPSSNAHFDAKQTPLQKISRTAKHLNEASDKLTALVARLDASLKKLNLGVFAWVVTSDEGMNEDFFCYREKLGYAKIGSKWCIALMTEEGTHGETSEIKTWAFNEAPREMRLRSVSHIPALIAALDEQAQSLTEQLNIGIDNVAELAAALDGGAQ